MQVAGTFKGAVVVSIGMLSLKEVVTPLQVRALQKKAHSPRTLGDWPAVLKT